MNKIRFVLAVTLALSFVAPAVRAQESEAAQSGDVALNALQNAVRSNRKAVVADRLTPLASHRSQWFKARSRSAVRPMTSSNTGRMSAN